MNINQQTEEQLRMIGDHACDDLDEDCFVMSQENVEWCAKYDLNTGFCPLRRS